jgi:soluble lytic murein transglycosylase-like protein
MASAQLVGRQRFATMLIMAAVTVGLTAESLPGDADSPTSPDAAPSEAILRYITDSNPGVPADRLRAYATALPALSIEHGIDHCLALAQAQVESKFSPDIVGGAGEVGLYQILPSTAALLGQHARDLFDPLVNAEVALFYFRSILERRPALRDALAEYNGGPRNRSPYYALSILETYAQVLRHQDLECAPHRNPIFAAPSHVLPGAGVARASFHPSR